jgi:hypothetical protein
LIFPPARYPAQAHAEAGVTPAVGNIRFGSCVDGAALGLSALGQRARNAAVRVAKAAGCVLRIQPPPIVSS